MLGQRNTSFVLISRAPLAKLEGYKKLKGWKWPWYSSFGSDFNCDFDATNDKGEAHGLSVFFRIDDDVFHTYSTYRRGTESLTDAYALLDRTPYGRQEDFEDSPPGWPQKPTTAEATRSRDRRRRISQATIVPTGTSTRSFHNGTKISSSPEVDPCGAMNTSTVDEHVHCQRQRTADGGAARSVPNEEMSAGTARTASFPR